MPIQGDKPDKSILLQTLLDFGHWPLADDGNVVVCCSGGIDSVALAHATAAAVRSLSEEECWQKGPPVVILWHLRHSIRSDDIEDAKLVQELAQSLDLEFVEDQVDARAERIPGTDSLESAARRLRYDRLHHFMKSRRNSLAFTAHHANDNAETILFNLVRGTGPAGLRGINPRTQQNVFRPLLDLPAETIKSYARNHGLQWREDSSNQDTSHSRNYIRKEIFPRLLQLNPSSVEHINRLALYGRELLQKRNDAEFVVRTKEELVRHLPLLRIPAGRIGTIQFNDATSYDMNTLAKALSCIGFHAEFRILTEIHSSLTSSSETVHVGNWHFSFPDHIRGMIFYEKTEQTGDDSYISIDTTVVEGIKLADDALLDLIDNLSENIISIKSPGNPEINNWNDWLARRNFDLVEEDRAWTGILPMQANDGLHFRTRRAGDRITLTNGVVRKIGDVFTDLKIPVMLRDCWALLVDSQQRVVWIPGVSDSIRMHERSSEGNYILATVKALE